MKNKIIIFSLIGATCLTLTSCGSDEVKDINEANILNIVENISYDKEMDAYIKLHSKSDVDNSLKDLINSSKEDKELAKLPEDIRLNIDIKDVALYDTVDVMKGEKIKLNLYGQEWEYYDYTNVYNKVTSVSLTRHIQKVHLSEEEQVKEFKEITEKLLESNKGLLYAKNPGINIARDNTKLEAYKNYIEEGLDDKVDEHIYKEEQEKNIMYLVFEGEDFYSIYYVFNDVLKNRISYNISYFSKDAHYRMGVPGDKESLNDIMFMLTEEGIKEIKGKSDLPKMYIEPDGKVVEYKRNLDTTEEEIDIMNYLAAPSSEDKDDKYDLEDRTESSEFFKEEQSIDGQTNNEMTTDFYDVDLDKLIKGGN